MESRPRADAFLYHLPTAILLFFNSTFGSCESELCPREHHSPKSIPSQRHTVPILFGALSLFAATSSQMSSQPARPRPSRDDMAVPFTEVERVDAGRTGSAVTLSQLDSAAPTLNNTPSGSRSPSPVRKKAPSRSPTPLPEQVDLKVTDSKQRLIAVSSHCDQELALAWMGSIVITCFFTSGLIDAVAFNSWSCFVGMQTGMY